MRNKLLVLSLLFAIFGSTLYFGYTVGKALKASVGLRSADTQVLAPLSPINNDKAKLSPIVRLHMLGNGEFFCSGTVISPHVILTAAHCLRGAPLLAPVIDVRDVDGNALGVAAAVLNYSPRTDLGLILGDFSRFNQAKIETSTVKVIRMFTGRNAKVIACGFPMGGPLYCSPVTDVEQYAFSFKAQGYLYPGMSGGPVFNRIHGIDTVIGVNTAVIDSGIVLSPINEIFTQLEVLPE